jgi:oligosaccharide repeat unit polymerase
MVVSLAAGAFLLLISLVLKSVVKDGLHPSVVFTMTWGLVLMAIGISQPFGYFQIGLEALLIILIGVIFYIAGSLAQIKRKSFYSGQVDYQIDYRKILIFCILLHAVMIPISFDEISSITQNSEDIYASAYRLREASVSGEEKVGFLVGNYLTLGLFFVPILLVGWIQRKLGIISFLLITVPWLVINVYVNGRSGIVTLLLCCIYIYLAQGKRISIRAIAVFALAFMAVLVAGNLLVGKIDATLDEGLFAVLLQSLVGFANYLMQGPILFSEYIKNPVAINPSWDALIFFCQILSKVEMCVLPVLHQDYMSFTRDGDIGNVYSVFFSIYPNYGWIGIIFFFWVYGLWSAFHHVRANNSLMHLLLAGFLFSACTLSIFSDAYGMNLYFFIKIIFIYLISRRVFAKKTSNSSNTGEISSQHKVPMAAISGGP